MLEDRLAGMPDILTEHLALRLETPEKALARIEAMSQEDRDEVSPVWLARLKAAPSPDPWTHGFAMLQRGSDTTVGSCGYKGPPDRDASVEIAYGVDPAFEGRGYATEAARALAEFAFATGNVRVVRAHTRPEPSASTRVLTKCGFTRVGEVIDPEDGLVWRWELWSTPSKPSTR